MFVAQTNIALYEQMKSKDYTLDEILLMKSAYEFAASARSINLRGSGKPFICHLVGTASLMVGLSQPINQCVASLLHAMYLRGSDFGVGMKTKGRRLVLQQAFGIEIERLVYAYHKLKWRYSDEQISDLTTGHRSQEEESIILMKVCNEAEDFLDNASLYTGTDQDDVKSAEWRLEYMRRSQPKFRAICEHLAVPQLGEFIDTLIEKSLASQFHPRLQSGHNKSFRNLGPSIRDIRSGPSSALRFLLPAFYKALLMNMIGQKKFKKIQGEARAKSGQR